MAIRTIVDVYIKPIKKLDSWNWIDSLKVVHYEFSVWMKYQDFYGSMNGPCSGADFLQQLTKQLWWTQF
jgi:hypothetical protein